MKIKCAVIALAAAVLAAALTATALYRGNREAPVSWEEYSATVDWILAELGKHMRIGQEEQIITVHRRMPWADRETDTMDEDPNRRRKRAVRVDLENESYELYMITYYTPEITAKGFAGVFRLYNTEHNLVMCTAYAPGITVTALAIPLDNEAEIDYDQTYTEYDLISDIQIIIDAMEQ